MKMIENKIIFSFSKKDVEILKQLINLAREEDCDSTDIGYIFTDIVTPNPEKRMFNLSGGFNTFNIEIES